MQMHTSKWFVRALAVLALLVAITACGSNSKSASSGKNASSKSPAAASGSTASAPSGSPIKVGELCSCSGNQLTAAVVPASQAFDSWVKSVNASGGVAGHPVQVTHFDDASNPGTSATDAQTLINDHVSAIVDDTISDASWANAAAAANIPVLGGLDTQADFTNPDFYPSAQTEDNSSYSLVAIAKQAGAKSIGVLYCAETPICQQTVPIIKSVGQKLGVTEKYSASVSATSSDFTAQCVAAQQANVKALYVSSVGPVLAKVAQACHRQNYNPIYVAQSATYGNGSSLKSVPGLSTGLWMDFSDLPYFAKGPQVQAMTSALNKYHPGLLSSAAWSEEGAQGWATGELVGQAVTGAGGPPSATVDAAAMTRGLTSIKANNLQGWSSPLTFAPGKPHPVDCWFTVKLNNGSPSVTNNGKPVCGGATP